MEQPPTNRHCCLDLGMWQVCFQNHQHFELPLSHHLHHQTRLSHQQLFQRRQHHNHHPQTLWKPENRLMNYYQQTHLNLILYLRLQYLRFHLPQL
jgi:hypothetical protein